MHFLSRDDDNPKQSQLIQILYWTDNTVLNTEQNQLSADN